MSEPLFYTLDEVASMLRRSKKTVCRLIADRQLRRDPTSYRVLIVARDVDTFTERGGRRFPAQTSPVK